MAYDIHKCLSSDCVSRALYEYYVLLIFPICESSFKFIPSGEGYVKIQWENMQRVSYVEVLRDPCKSHR